jgi:hypothetical protein
MPTFSLKEGNCLSTPQIGEAPYRKQHLPLNFPRTEPFPNGVANDKNHLIYSLFKAIVGEGTGYPNPNLKLPTPIRCNFPCQFFFDTAQWMWANPR